MSGPMVMPTVDRTSPWTFHAVRILSIRTEIEHVKTYEMEFEDAETASRFQFLPGQFHMLYLPGIGEAAISISSDPAEPRRFLHTIRALGNVTHALDRCRVGDTVFLRGPFGSHWPIERFVGEDVMIAAGGLGLAPLRPAIYHLLRERDRFGRVLLLYGARTPADLLYRDELADWQSHGIETLTTVDLGDSDWEGPIGVVTSLMRRVSLNPSRAWLMTCGPEIMMRFIAHEAILLGLERSRMFLSMERNMSCALGLCGRCQFGPAFVCKNGPVFSYDQLEPYLHVEDF